MIGKLLVAMDVSSHGEAAAALAIGWPQRFGPELDGLGVLDEPTITRPEPVPLGATSFRRERDETLLARAHARVRGFLEVRDRCGAATDGEGVLVAYCDGQEMARTLQSFTLLGVADNEMTVVLAIAPDGAI